MDVAQFLLLAMASSGYYFCYWKVFINIIYKETQGINISSPHHLSQDPFGTSRPPILIPNMENKGIILIRRVGIKH